MIKVLNIISDTNIGGAGRVILNYLKYANRDEFDTFVALPKGSLLIGPLNESGVKVIEVDGIADKSFDKADISKLEKVIKDIKPDIVHTHGSLSGRIAAKKCKVKIVYTRHSVFPLSWKIKYFPGKLVNKLVNEYYSDRIIAVSPAAKDNLTDGGISGNKITTIMNGVSPVEKLGVEEVAKVKTSYGINDDEFVMLLLARIEEYKGHLSVVEAAKKLKEDGRKFNSN